MTRNEIIETVPFLLSFREFVIFFERQYGEIKLKDIVEKVHTSKKCINFLRLTFDRKIRPGTDDYLTVIHSSSSFTFAKAETISMATAVLLHRWDDAIGKTLQTSDDFYLNKVFFSILEKCDRYKTHIATTSNFFTEFLLHLSNYVDNSRFANPAKELEETDSLEIKTIEETQFINEELATDVQPTYEEEEQNMINYIYSITPAQSKPLVNKTKEQKNITIKTEPKDKNSAYFIRGVLYCGTCHISLNKDSRCPKCKTKYDAFGKRSIL